MAHHARKVAWALAGLIGLLCLSTVSQAQVGTCGCRICDSDGDTDVDQCDFGHLQACFSGSLPIADPRCLDADLDGNGAINQDDLAILVACASGAQVAVSTGDLDGIFITEFVASNANGLADEDGSHPDWIELYNPCRPVFHLAGYYLTDDPTELTKWAFPAVAMTQGQYLVVFASGKDRTDPSKPLHTSFKLSDNGNGDALNAFIALVAPDGHTIVSAYPQYPQQLTDVSYGLSQSAVKLVSAATSVRYRVPTVADAGLGAGWTDPDYSDADWSAGPTGMGFSSAMYFTVTTYKASITVDTLAKAESVVVNPAQQSWAVTETAPVVNYLNTSGSANYENDAPFPGTQIGSDVNDFVVLVTGTVMIPAAGEYTFGVNSDDGFHLKLTRGATVLESSHPNPRGPADTLKTFGITEPGAYQVWLVYYERGGGSELEFFWAPGYHEAFNASVFRLVGEGQVSVLPADIGTDVGSAMRGNNASLWVRVPFQIAEPSAYNLMTLRVKYEDGFVAYLNGHEVIRRNAPANLAWNSAATADRPIGDAADFETFNLTNLMSYLRPGSNLLAIHGLNNDAGNGDFLVLPELAIGASTDEVHYFATPTPGAPNTSGSIDFCHGVEFSAPRGLYESPFQLVLTPATAGSQIRYTLDGSTPTVSHGTDYTGPITIDKTSTVRAAAFRDNYLPSRVATHTYLFIDDVIQHSPDGVAPGPGWPSGSVNGQTMNYGLDPNILNDLRYSALMHGALLSIPSISLVTDLGNLFDPAAGIYVNAYNDGRDWERLTSVELLNPDGSEGFQINGGLRIRGGYSRSGGNPKHAFRLFFRAEYGDGRLKFPLFGDEGASEFTKVDLATAQNYSWSFEGDYRSTFLRDVFSRDAQGAMGEPYGRSRFYHLYINGVYWGLYYTDERPEADFAATYFGGSDSDYDVIKCDPQSNYEIYATNGDIDAFYRLWQMCGEDGATQYGGVTNEVYQQLLGCNPDGTRNADYDVMVDPDSLIDYMLCTILTGDPDGPVSVWGQLSNNFFAIRDRNGLSGFRFFRHDAEHSMGCWSRDPNEDRTGPFDVGRTFNYFNPFRIHQDFAVCSDYRTHFSDHVYQMMFNGGPLTDQPNIARMTARRDQIDLAIIAESARWGDSKREPPRNRIDDWLPEVNWILDTYLPNRTNVVVQQLRNKGWFRDPPAFSRAGGNVALGTEVTLSFPAGVGGTVYYTLDGTDPRLPGGAVVPQALSFESHAVIPTPVTLVARNAMWKYLDDGSNQAGTGWMSTILGFEDSNWKGPQATRLGYGNDGETLPRLSYGPSSSSKHITYYFRHTFAVGDSTQYASLKVCLLRDDGGVVYINGTQLPLPSSVTNMPATFNYRTTASSTVDASNGEQTFFEGTVDLTAAPYNTLLVANATNLVAVEVHQISGSSTDLGFDLELIAIPTSPPPATETIVINENTRLKARVLDNTGEWSAVNTADYLVGAVPLYINEVMASNATALEDPEEPGAFPDWFELYNPNPFEVELGGMYVTDELATPTKWQLPRGLSIKSGEFMVFYADSDPTQGARHVDFKLDGTEGEAVGLFDRDGVTRLDAVQFGPQTADVSIGRYPNGTGAWGAMADPTPGEANSAHTLP
ncbi:MAG: chitobiase/beta-hexosaminidase C-terminal domain-containing protein [Phycisphaerae bacterium]|nr:chitobiase/beta-hexosaminidase C-terminal domain-containing protein [Phycisphaerae bacterium]